MAEAERRRTYIKLIEQRWGDDWIERLAHSKLRKNQILAPFTNKPADDSAEAESQSQQASPDEDSPEAENQSQPASEVDNGIDIVERQRRDLDMRPKPRNDRGPSLTTIKHLAIAAFWMSLIDAKEHLGARIEHRRSRTGNKRPHCIPNDVKWVLLNKLEGAAKDKDWNALANEALNRDWGEGGVVLEREEEDREGFRVKDIPAGSSEGIEKWMSGWRPKELLDKEA